MDRTSSPGVTRVDVLQLLPVEKVLQQLCIVPQGSLVEKPEKGAGIKNVFNNIFTFCSQQDYL